MLQFARILPNILVKRTSRNCSLVKIHNLLSFSSTTSSNIVACKDEDNEVEIFNTNNIDDKTTKFKEEISNLNSVSFSKEFIILMSNLEHLQSLRNNKNVNLDVLLKENDDHLKKIISGLMKCTSVEINILMSKLNMKRMNNLLVEENISEEIIFEVLKKMKATESIHFLNQLAFEKLRPTGILETLTNNLLTAKIPLDQSIDILKCMAHLNFYNENLLPLLINNVIEEISSHCNPTIFSSIVKSLGILRIKNEILLNILSIWLLENSIIVKPDDVRNFLITLAILGCATNHLNEIVQKILIPMHTLKICTKFIWLDIVWALTILNHSMPYMYESVLNAKFTEDLFGTSNIIIPKCKKLLNINGIASLKKSNYRGSLLERNSPIFSIPIKFSKNKLFLSNSIILALKLLLPADEKYLSTIIDKKMGFLIDAEFCVDDKLTPYPVTLNFAENINRIAVMSVDYHELCYKSDDIIGRILFYSKLLEEQGYRVLLLRHSEMFNKSSSLDRAKYIINQLKILLNYRFENDINVEK